MRQALLDESVNCKRCTTWELWILFYLGQNEDCSPGDNTSDSSERLLQKNKENTVQSSLHFTKSFLLVLRSWCYSDRFRTCSDIVVQSLSHLWLFVTPWTTARQSFMSFAISPSLLKLMSIESIMPSNHLILYHPFSCCLLLFPASGLFLMSQFFPLGGQSIGASTSASVLPMNIQDWFPLGLTGLIYFQSKWLSRVFPNTAVQKHQLFGAQPSLWSNSHIHTWLLEIP